MKKKIFVFIFSLIVLACATIVSIFSYNYYEDGIHKKKVVLKSYNDKTNADIAFYIDNGSGGFTQSGTAPTSGYVLNTTRTHCLNGGQIAYDSASGTVTYDIKGQDRCYVYFDALIRVNVTVTNGTASASYVMMRNEPNSSITITANSGYTLDGATVNGTGVSCSLNNGVLTISNITGTSPSCSISAK